MLSHTITIIDTWLFYSEMQKPTRAITTFLIIPCLGNNDKNDVSISMSLRILYHVVFSNGTSRPSTVIILQPNGFLENPAVRPCTLNASSLPDSA